MDETAVNFDMISIRTVETGVKTASVRTLVEIRLDTMRVTDRTKLKS